MLFLPRNNADETGEAVLGEQGPGGDERQAPVDGGCRWHKDIDVVVDKDGHFDPVGRFWHVFVHSMILLINQQECHQFRVPLHREPDRHPRFFRGLYHVDADGMLGDPGLRGVDADA